jgi:hypothetical protein
MGPHDPIKPVESMLNTQSYEIGDSPRVRSRTSSSSSFSVQSRSDNSGEREEGWTRVNEMNGGGTRRRRFITESSCASHRSDHSQVTNVIIFLIAYLSICLIYRCFWR